MSATEIGADERPDSDKLGPVEPAAGEQRQVRAAGGAPRGVASRVLQLVAWSLRWAIDQLLARLASLARLRQHETKRAQLRGPARGDNHLEVQSSSRQTERDRRSVAHTADARSALDLCPKPARLRRVPPIQMTQEIVAGFEEQQVAHELSAQVVEEALQAIVGRLEMAAHDATTQKAPATGQVEAGARPAPDLESRHTKQQAGRDGSPPSELGDEADEHCGRQASEVNLRQLRLSALEDVLVCDQRRHKTSAARRHFNELAASASGQREAQRERPMARLARPATASQKCSSLSSRSSCGAGDNQSDEEANSSASNQMDIDYLDELLGGCDSSSADDCGLIKLDRRCCSSSSSSSVNFGRTLVCSVSPTSHFNFSAPASRNSNGNHCRPMNIHERAGGPYQERDDDDLGYYAVNGDEIRHCRAAFRENRRLIEQVQSEVSRRHRGEAGGAGSGLRRAGSQAAIRPSHTSLERARWADSLGRGARLAVCSHCKQKLYPVDRMELDFTRATLNIHRNCFKCQVCATLLRLETYASIDTKLYCPAHVRCVAPSR